MKYECLLGDSWGIPLFVCLIDRLRLDKMHAFYLSLTEKAVLVGGVVVGEWSFYVFWLLATPPIK